MLYTDIIGDINLEVNRFSYITITHMTRGRKPRAISVTEQSGGYKKNPSRRPKNQINGDPRLPSVPDFVEADPEALKVWNETVDVLKDCGILTKTDTHLLTAYVLTYSEWKKCIIHISANGHKDENGKTSPESVALFKLAASHQKLLSEIGLSPSSRARLSVATSEERKEETTSLASIIKLMKE